MSRFLVVVHFLKGEGEAAGIRGVSHAPVPGLASSPTVTPLGLTHVPGAYEDRDHVRLILLAMLVLHELQKLAEGFSLLVEGGREQSTHTGASQGQQAPRNPTLPQGYPALQKAS